MCIYIYIYTTTFCIINYHRNALDKEIGIHKLIYGKTWNNAPYSKGIHYYVLDINLPSGRFELITPIGKVVEGKARYHFPKGIIN